MKVSLFEQNSTEYTVEEISELIKNQLGFDSKILNTDDAGQKMLVVILDTLEDIVIKIGFSIRTEGESKDRIISTYSFLVYIPSEVDATDTATSILAVSSALQSALQVQKLLSETGVFK